MAHSPTSIESPQHLHNPDVLSSPVEEERPAVGPLGSHKRSVSASLLSKLSFLRMSQNGADGGDRRTSSEQLSEENDLQSPGGALATALQQQKKGRKRKGSLRKTALLGTGVLRLDKDKKTPTALKNTETVTILDNETETILLASPTSPDEITPRPSYDGRPPVLDQSNKPQLNINPDLPNGYTPSSPSIRSPTEASTTDDDDFITFPRLPINLAAKRQPSISSSDSYFPLQSDHLTRRRISRVKSPLATQSVEITPATDDWDYAQTEFWGWIILFVTWIVFVVGMGSCLGVWSWAWDVGTTPVAPPELEDDPTLPIVGYYPALIILTAVMAWVWVVVAWVGMKYFKHANIIGDDT